MHRQLVHFQVGGGVVLGVAGGDLGVDARGLAVGAGAVGALGDDVVEPAGGDGVSGTSQLGKVGVTPQLIVNIGNLEDQIIGKLRRQVLAN